jgi:hypothetical protein
MHHDVRHFTNAPTALLYEGTAPHPGVLADAKQEMTMKTIVQIALASTILFGAASSALAGRDQESGEDRYPALADQADAQEAAKYRAWR